MNRTLRATLVAGLAAALAILAFAAGAQPGSGTGSAPQATAPATRPAAAPTAGPADDNKVDAVAATVNDEVILESDVEEQLYLFLMRAQQQPDPATTDTLRRQILNQLIDEKLVVAEAKRQAITVPDAEVNKQVNEAVADARERMGSQAAFEEQLAKEGITEEKLRERYREEVRRQMVAQRLVQKSVPRKPVTQADAETYFKANPGKFPNVPAEVRLSVIQIPVEPDSVTDRKARLEIEAIAKRLKAGEKFAKVATEVSDDEGSARSGGDLGYFTRGSLDPDFERAAFAQKLNEVSPPVKSAFGWHLIEVLDRDTVKTTAGRDSLDASGAPVPEVHVRHILVKVEIGEPDVERAKALADRVHAEAVKGADFGKLAERYSKYSGPRSPDGDVGFVSMGTLQPNIRAGLDSVQVGGVSAVLVNRSGFNIFKITDRRDERPYTLEEIKKELPEAVAQVQFRERYEAWIAGLRSKAQIRIR